MEQQSTSKDSAFFLVPGVQKGSMSALRIRFDTILKDRGLKWSEVYHELGLSKSYASSIRNGTLIPPRWLKVKISVALSCDTSILWEVEEGK